MKFLTSDRPKVLTTSAHPNSPPHLAELAELAETTARIRDRLSKNTKSKKL